MAAHVRTAVRQAIVTALINAATDAGAKVFDSRVTQIQPEELPVIIVRSGRETQAVEVIGAPAVLMNRALAIEVEAVIAESDTYAESLDRLMAQIESAVAANCFAGKAKNIYPTDYGEIGDAAGTVVTVKGIQAFQVFYLTSQAAPGTAL